MLPLPQGKISGTGEFSKQSKALSETEVHGKQKDCHIGLNSASVATIARVRASAIIFLPTVRN